MAKALNAAAFDKPHWGLVARGWGWSEHDTYFSARGGIVERNGGIENPNRASLYVGSCYYRFVDLQDSPNKQQGGGWWVDYDQLLKIIHGCSSRGLNLSQMARASLAVPWEWNHADGIVRATIAARLDAYEGRGAPVRPGKTYRGTYSVDGGGSYPGDRNVLQLYIPDMRSVWQQALTGITVQPVREFAIKYRDIIRV
ncbi:hypothetical protein [Roseomonas sp. WA12]